VDYWTYKAVPETVFYQFMPDGQPAFANSTRTLWEMGNVLISMLDEIYFNRDVWGENMDKQPAWQYAYLNGPGGNSQACSEKASVDALGSKSMSCRSGWLASWVPTQVDLSQPARGTACQRCLICMCVVPQGLYSLGMPGHSTPLLTTRGRT
jgi:hypothetical protein